MVFYSLQLEWEKYSLENKQSIGGKYFDDQRQRLETALQNKNAQLNNEWRERYDERERKNNNNSNSRKKEMMSRVELKNMHSTELRKLKKRIQEELNFREDIGKEIQPNHKIEDSLFTKEEEEERIRIYEEKN